MRAQRQAAFGLVELLVAMTLGLILVLGVVQVFLASKQTFLVQRSAATVQEDARYVLARIAQELRMLDAYGCVDLARVPASLRSSIPAAFDTPITYSGAGSATFLSLITAVPHNDIFATAAVRSPADYGARWLIVSNCRDTDDLRISSADSLSVRPGDVVIPLRQVEYRLHDHALQVRNNAAGNYQTLIEGVAELNWRFGLAATAESRQVHGGYVDSLAPEDVGRVRSIKVELRLSDQPADPDQGNVLAQPFRQVVAIRNRID